MTASWVSHVLHAGHSQVGRMAPWLRKLPRTQALVSVAQPLTSTCAQRNTSDQTRHIVQVHYGARVTNTRFPPYLNSGAESVFQYNPVCVAAANPRQRRLIGAHTSADKNDKKSPYF